MKVVYSSEREPQQLGELLAKGGEGEIYPLRDRPEILIKIYHDAILKKRGKDLQDKVQAMRQVTELRNNRKLSWPLIPVYDAQQRWVGYAMYRAKGIPMAKLAHAMLYQKNFPGLNRRKVAGYLLNLLETTRFLHNHGVMIGDCNLQNILCDPNSEDVVLIDCDSYQLSVSGKHYPCPVGMADMTPKEQQGKDFSKVLRTEESEAFSIAIIMFMSLMLGRHPYDIQGGTERAENLRRAAFAYGKGNKGIPKGRWYNIWSHMPHKLKELFIRTFTDGAEAPQHRATLAEWIEALTLYRKEIDKGWHEVAMAPTEPKKSEYRGSRVGVQA
ncbi:kinase [Noviherbaspirillum sp. UKPF54]|uniref:kinase n=1 Tax=Noviherbaspirillum sp. UKPF54 TaxID=2601898 RepID=UPI0011B14A06|nr:kinase [Noviherbaspirillum sp. UKPF54]QDZ26580.1 kinase [Noviherbaspirillum sp. UKPF54]